MSYRICAFNSPALNLYKQRCVLCVMSRGDYSYLGEESYVPFAWYCLFGWFIISLSGSMFHFTYQWTHCNWIVGSFMAVNESVFEHMKILSFPVFIFWLVDCVICALWYDDDCVIKHIVSVNAAIYSGAFFMGVVHLVVSVGFGFEPLWFDIFLFFVSAFVAQYVGLCLLRVGHIPDFFMYASVFCLLFACGFHVYCTDNPPKFMPVLFEDPGLFYGRPSNCTLLNGFTPIRNSIVFNSTL